MEKVLILMLLLSGCMDTKQKLLPVIWSNNSYVFQEKLLTPEFCENLEMVLKYYNEEYELKNECDLYVTKELANDKDLLMNYTNKAQDSKWLEDHIK